jgi:ferredoxin
VANASEDPHANCGPPPNRTEEAIVKLTVDREKCAGHARCATIDPELFELDVDGYITFSEKAVPPGKEAAARQGQNACPEQVIRLIEDAAIQPTD